ncbi:MAG: ABC transporter permease [Bacteroidales bacterium]|nr:ABC transporter permease [Bacteroidales bacterium]
MNFEYFVAKKLLKQKRKTFSKPIVSIATAGIALSIAVMLISIGVLQGFKNQIKDKITGFTSHIHLVPFAINTNNTSNYFTLSKQEIDNLYKEENIKTIDPYVLAGGAIKTKTDFHGVALKGVEESYDTIFFKENLKSGSLPDYSKTENKNQILISQTIADKLDIKIGDKIKIYFYIDQKYRVRPFTIAGIYETGLGDYDNKFILCNAKILQKLYSMQENQYSGYEVKLKDFAKLNQSAQNLYTLLSQDKDLQTIEEMEPSLFAWLDLLDSNVILILIVMTFIAIITSCSTLLIMIFEQTKHIGILKSLGAKTSSIIKIYLYKSLYIVARAMLIGNGVVITLMYLQQNYKLIKLDQESYYLDSVPIEFSAFAIVSVNLASIIICMASLIFPARNISKINPMENIKFE